MGLCSSQAVLLLGLLQGLLVMDRCTGHCCFPIMLPYGPSELHAKRDELTDGNLMADSFVYLGRKTESGQSVFACKHFKNGQCTIHETKPDVCSRYPYDKPCKVPGCTWSEVAALMLPAPNGI